MTGMLEVWLARIFKVVALGLTVLLAGCGQPPPPEITVTITPSASTLRSAQKVQLNAVVNNASNTAVTWTTTGGILDVNGSNATFTMPNLLQQSSYTVTASSVADPSKKASATLSFDTSSQARIEFTSDPSVLLTKQGEKAQLTAVVYKNDGSLDTAAKVEWLSSAPDQVSVNSSGEVTAQSNLGSAQIMASYGDLEPKIASAYIASLRPETKLISSGTVKSLDATNSQVVLAKNTNTQAFQVGDVLFDGGKNALLARVTAVQINADNVRVTVESAGLPDAFSAMKVVNSDLPEEFRTKLLKGQAKRASSTRQTTPSGPCKFENTSVAAEFKLGTISGNFGLLPFFDWEIDVLGLKWYRVGAAGNIRVQGTLGELKITGGLTEKISCKVKGGVIFIPALAAGPVLIDGLLTGELGIEITGEIKTGLTCSLVTLDYGVKAYAGVQYERNIGESPLKGYTTTGNGFGGPKCSPEPAQLGIKLEPFIGTELAVGMDFPFPVPGFHVGLLEGKIIGGLEVKHDAFYEKTDELFRGFDWNLYAGVVLSPEPWLRDIEAFNKSISKFFKLSNPKSVELKFKFLEVKLPFFKSPSFFLKAPRKATAETEVNLEVSSDITAPSILYGLTKAEFWAIKGNAAPFKIGEAKLDGLGSAKMTWKTPKLVAGKDNSYKIRALIYDDIFSQLDSPSYASKAVDLSVGDFDVVLEPATVFREAKVDETVVGMSVMTNYSTDIEYLMQSTTGVATLTGSLSGTMKNLERRFISFRAKCNAVGEFHDVIEIDLVNTTDPSALAKRFLPFTLKCNDKKKPKPNDPPSPAKPPLNGSSGGDPHLMTFDGRFYDFQAVGDFILAKSLIPGDSFEVQTRYRKPLVAGASYSLGYAIAANIEGTRVETYATPSGKPKLFVDSKEVSFADSYNQALSGGGAITIRGGEVVLAWSDTSSVSISFGADYIGNIRLYVNGRQRGQLEGLLGDGDGDANNDLKIRGGAVLSNPSQKDIYLQYRQSWHVKVASSEALFTQGSDLFDPFFPPNVLTLADLDPAAVEQAKQICFARGIVTEDVFQACVFDIALTGDPAWADYAFQVDPNVPAVYLRPLASFVPIGRVDRIRRFGAFVTGVENDSLTWKVSGGKLIQVSGNVIDFVAPQTEGTYDITATLVSDPSLTSTARVIVAPPSFVFWDGGGDGHSWSDPKNWAEDKLPTADSDVIVKNFSLTPITMNANIPAVYSLRTEGNVTLSSGNLKLLGDSSLASGFTLAGGNLETKGTVTLTGATTWAIGRLGGTGKFVNNGELGLIAGNYKYLDGTLENPGTIKISDNLYSGANGSVLKNTGTLEFVADINIQTSTGYINLQNSGLIVKTSGTGISYLDTDLLNTGTLEARVGTLRIDRGTLDTGTYTATTGATLQLNANLTLKGTLSGSPTGAVAVINANLNVNASDTAHLNFGGTGFDFRIGNILGLGTLKNDNLMLFSGGNYKYLSGTLSNAGTIQFSDTLYSGAVGSVFKNTGTLEILGDTAIVPSSGYIALQNSGLIVKTAGTGIAYLNTDLLNTGTLESRSGILRIDRGTLDGGVYKVSLGQTLRFSSDITYKGTLTGNPEGTLEVLDGNINVPSAQEAHLKFGGSGFNFSVGRIVGSGKLVNDANSLMNLAVGNYKYLDGTLENAGTIKVSDNIYSGNNTSLVKNFGTLEFVNDSNFLTSTGKITLENSGLLVKTGGAGVASLQLSTLTNAGTLESRSGILRIQDGVVIGGTYNATTLGILELTGDVTVKGTLSGAPLGSVRFLNGNLNIPSTETTHLNFGGTGFDFQVGQILGPGKLSNDNLMLFSSGNYKYLHGTLENAGTIKISDTLYSGNAGNLFKNAGTVELISDAANFRISSGGINFDNAGSVLKTGGSGISTLQFSTLNNTGTLEARLGTLRIEGGTIIGGTYNALAGAILEFTSTVTLKGTLSGNATGSIRALNANLQVLTGDAAHLNFAGTGFDFQVGQIIGAGKLVNDGTMLFSGGNYKYLLGTLENAALLKISDHFYSGNVGSTLRNLAGATIEFTNDSGILESTGRVTFSNAGTLLKSGGTGNSIITTVFSNTGTITEASGHFVFTP